MSATRDLKCCLIVWRDKDANQSRDNFEFACGKVFRDNLATFGYSEPALSRSIMRGMLGLHGVLRNVPFAAVEAEWISRRSERYNYEHRDPLATSGAFLLESIVERLKFFEAKLNLPTAERILDGREKGLFHLHAIYTAEKTDGILVDASSRVDPIAKARVKECLRDVLTGTTLAPQSIGERVLNFVTCLRDCVDLLNKSNFEEYRRAVRDCLNKSQSLFGDIEIVSEAVAPFTDLVSHGRLCSAREFGRSLVANFDLESPVDVYDRQAEILDRELEQEDRECPPKKAD